MLFMNFLQRIGLDPDGGNLVNVLGFILKNNAAAQIFGKLFIFFRIDDRRTGEMHSITAIFVIFMNGILHGKMQIIRDHTDHHFPVIAHLAFQMIIICAIY